MTARLPDLDRFSDLFRPARRAWVIKRGGQTLRYTPTPDDGTERLRLRVRTIRGWRIGVYWAKNVGPPRWPWPRLTAKVRRGVMVGAGWNWTCYSVGVVPRRTR
jgi:hypothetical protein